MSPGRHGGGGTALGVVSLDGARRHSAHGDRRSRGSLPVLSRHYDESCTSAVDPWEIAAWLEAAGMSDRACHAYGFPDVFTLAEALFALVPRRGSNQVTASTREPVSTRKSLLRGVIYALPGLVSVGAVNQTRRSGVVVILCALAVGWGWSQAMSFLGHRRLGWEGHRAARALLRHGLVGGLLVIPALVALLAWAWHAPTQALVGGIAVGWYMVGAGVLLVLGDDGRLLAALTPGSVAGLLFVLDIDLWGREVQMLLAGSSVLAVVVIAAIATRERASAGSHGATVSTGRQVKVTREDATSALGHLVYGVLCAAAVGLGPLTLAVLQGRPVSSTWYVALPLVLSMGLVELQLQRLRLRMDYLMRVVVAPQQFARKAQTAFVVSLVGYLIVVTLIAAMCAYALASKSPSEQSTGTVLVAGYVALAACFFVALVLVSIGRVLGAVAGLASGLTVYLVLALLRPDAAIVVYVAAFSALFLVLLAVALVRLRSPLVHL